MLLLKDIIQDHKNGHSLSPDQVDRLLSEINALGARLADEAQRSIELRIHTRKAVDELNAKLAELVQPSQVVAVPESIDKNEFIAICKNFCSKAGFMYLGDIEHAIAGLSTPTPPSVEQWLDIKVTINDNATEVRCNGTLIYSHPTASKFVRCYEPMDIKNITVSKIDDAQEIKDNISVKVLGDEIQVFLEGRGQIYRYSKPKDVYEFVDQSAVEQPDSAAPYVYFKKVNGKDEWSSWNEFSDGSSGGKPLFEGAQLAQRITEQDVREIAESVANNTSDEFGFDFDIWFENESGRTLLKKLNEHREPDYKAQRDLLLNAAAAINEAERLYSETIAEGGDFSIDQLKTHSQAWLLFRQSIARCEGEPK